MFRIVDYYQFLNYLKLLFNLSKSNMLFYVVFKGLFSFLGYFEFLYYRNFGVFIVEMNKIKFRF